LIPHTATHRLFDFIFFIAGIITWKGVTQDADRATRENLIGERIWLLLSLLGVFYYPGFVVLFLFVSVHYFKAYTIFQSLSIHILQMFLAFCVSVALIESALFFSSLPEVKITLEVPLFLILLVVASHYVVFGIEKLKLGKHWASWVLDNRTHNMTAAAIMRGWLRKWPLKKRQNLIFAIKPFNKILQALRQGYELAWLFALLDIHVALTLTAGAVIFHLVMFLLTGMLFWQSILVHMALFIFLFNFPTTLIPLLFNWPNTLLFAGLIILFPLRHKIWDPVRSAGWYTPFLGRLYYRAEGESGKIYEVLPKFFSPWDPFFSGLKSKFMMPHKIFHGFLGEVDSLQIVEGVIKSKGDLAAIKVLQEKYGTLKNELLHQIAVDAYLLNCFKNSNAHKRVRVCPRWLKAPPNIYYSSGSHLEPFNRQERVIKVIIGYRETYFTGDQFTIIQDEKVKELEVPIKKFVIEEN
jgi:hypothetical protein